MPPDSTVEPGFNPAKSVGGLRADAQQTTNAPSVRARSAIMIDAKHLFRWYEKQVKTKAVGVAQSVR